MDIVSRGINTNAPNRKISPKIKRFGAVGASIRPGEKRARGLYHAPAVVDYETPAAHQALGAANVAESDGEAGWTGELLRALGHCKNSKDCQNWPKLQLVQNSTLGF